MVVEPVPMLLNCEVWRLEGQAHEFDGAEFGELCSCGERDRGDQIRPADDGRQIDGSRLQRDDQFVEGKRGTLIAAYGW